MTQRLYYHDSYLREFPAQVVDCASDGRKIYLNRTAFYPTSGGQPYDTGSIAGVPVLEVVDEGDRIAHLTGSSVKAGEVDCAIDWQRRFDHMQQHSGQHLLSAVLLEFFGLSTASFHLGQDFSTIDLEVSSVDPSTLVAAEQRANQAVFENIPITVSFEDAVTAAALRKPSEREGVLRVVTITGLDRSACGGTHVRSTAEIGPILIRRQEKIRNMVRLEFLCGSRAVARARADFDALSRIAQSFSAALDDTPALVAAQLEAARSGDRLRRKLASDLARYQGRELYDAATPDAAGIRRVVRRLPAGSLEELRSLAQSFTAQPKAVFLAAVEQPPSLLLAASPDSGVDAGKQLKAAFAREGGRGGGNAAMAQGSLPDSAALERLLQELSR